MPRRPSDRPLDTGSLERLALRYVERFATTRGKLSGYLRRKIAERGWADESDPDVGGVAERMAELRYVDDLGYGEARAAAMARRGLGARRVTGALRVAGIDPGDAALLAPAIAERARASALAFARRRRIGPFADKQADRPAREKALAAMLRAGHDLELARTIVRMAPGEPLSDDETFDDCA